MQASMSQGSQSQGKKCKTSRNQLQRTHSYVLAKGQHSSQGSQTAAMIMNTVSATTPTTDIPSTKHSNMASKPQPAFTQIQQPKQVSMQVSTVKGKASQQSIDLTAIAENLPWGCNQLQSPTNDLQNIKIDPSFVEKLLTKKRSQNVSVDLSATQHRKNQSSTQHHLLAALKTARESGLTHTLTSSLDANGYVNAQLQQHLKQLDPSDLSAKRPNKHGKKESNQGSGGSAASCRINFIEHNKQRIKLMSANSKSRGGNPLEATQPVLTVPFAVHHQHSQSRSNLAFLDQNANSSQKRLKENFLNQSQNAEQSRNKKCGVVVMPSSGKEQTQSKGTLNVSLITTATQGNKLFQNPTNVLSKILETSSKTAVGVPGGQSHSMVDLKRKRNRRVDSFVWTGQSQTMQGAIAHQKKQSLVGQTINNEHGLEIYPPGDERQHTKKPSGGVTSRLPIEKENLLGSTQYLYQLLQGSAVSSSNSKTRQTHQRNQTSFNATAKGSFLCGTQTIEVLPSSKGASAKASFISKNIQAATSRAAGVVYHQKTSSQALKQHPPTKVPNTNHIIQPSSHKPSPSIVSSSKASKFQTPVHTAPQLGNGNQSHFSGGGLISTGVRDSRNRKQQASNLLNTQRIVNQNNNLMKTQSFSHL